MTRAPEPTFGRPAPSGRQLELRLGDQRAVITEVGAGLRAYEVGTWSVVDGYRRDELCNGGRGQLLVPWPNRIDHGRYRFGGVDHQLALDEPDRGNAIHGLVRWSPWELDRIGPARAVARHRLHPRPGYPFSLHVEVDYRLTDAGLAVRLTSANVGPTAAPYAAGWHPYLSVGTETVDEAVLQLPARQVVPTDERGLPSGEPSFVAGGRFDFRQPRPIGADVLDTCYTDLERGADGLVRAHLSAPGGRPSVELWADESVDHLMVFTGDTLAPGRRRRALALEPMTAAPNVYNSAAGPLVIEPGQASTTRWGISPRR